MATISLVGSHAIPHIDALSVLCEHIASKLAPGDVLLLTGELGAGKTTFTQLLGKALQVHERITSPTYTLLGEYPIVGNSSLRKLTHIDLYRTGNTSTSLPLNNDYIQEVLDAAEEERTVVVIEWGDLLGVPVKNRCWHIFFEVEGSGEGRSVTISITEKAYN